MVLIFTTDLTDWTDCFLCEAGSIKKPNKPFCLAWGSLARSRIPSRGQVFFLVYRLAMDAKTRKGDGVGG